MATHRCQPSPRTLAPDDWPAYEHIKVTTGYMIGQVIASVFGPRVADNRGESLTDRAIVKCAYSEAHFASGWSAG